MDCLASLALVPSPKVSWSTRWQVLATSLILGGIILPSAAVTDVALPPWESGLGYIGSQCGLCVSGEAFCMYRPRGAMWDHYSTGSALLRYRHVWRALPILSRVTLENGASQTPREHAQVQHLHRFRFFPWHSWWDSVMMHSNADTLWTLRILCSGWSRVVWVQPTHLQEQPIYTSCKELFKISLLFCGYMHVEEVLF